MESCHGGVHSTHRPEHQASSAKNIGCFCQPDTCYSEAASTCYRCIIAACPLSCSAKSGSKDANCRKPRLFCQLAGMGIGQFLLLTNKTDSLLCIRMLRQMNPFRRRVDVQCWRCLVLHFCWIGGGSPRNFGLFNDTAALILVATSLIARGRWERWKMWQSSWFNIRHKVFLIIYAKKHAECCE